MVGSDFTMIVQGYIKYGYVLLRHHTLLCIFAL